MRKRATANEVAKAAGVSKWTVIRAFSPGASITTASREKVLAAAKALNYSPNLLARSLATNLTHQVAVFVDDFGNPHKLPFLDELTATLQSEGMVAVLININMNFDHIRALVNAEQRQVDAVVLFGTSFGGDTLRDQTVAESFPPTFVLARDSQIDSVPGISCDIKNAMSEICNHLFHQNYKHPAFMSGPLSISTALGRRDGFVQFWQSKGVPVAEFRADKYSASVGAAAMREFLQNRSKPIDLIMCENDILACGAIDVITHEFCLRVPEDIAVVGFDNIDLAAAPAYNLTTYQQPREAMVRVMVDMILKRRPKESINLPGTLVVRGSA
jgi:LacI family transcriptional regulator